MVENFQHNWETDPRFRALWSGGLGLGIVVLMCACLGFAFTFASTAASFAQPSTGYTYNATPNGTAAAGSADSNLAFPTQTVPPWGAQQAPAAAPIPPSQTPAPTPTALPTATPLPTALPGTGGGGGGGGGGGSSGTVTVTGATLAGGSAGSVQIHTSAPNAQVNVFINWPNGVQSPQNTGSTDGSGNGTVTTTTVPAGCTGQVKLWVKTDISGTTTAYFPCTP